MATAQFTEVVDRAVGDVLTEPIWDDQLKDNINQLAGAHRNLLTNGGFEIWQRGAGSFTVSTSYSADRWRLSGTSTVTKETTTVEVGAASLKMVVTGAGVGVDQYLEDYIQLRGKTLTLSVRVNQNVAGGVAVTIGDNTGSSSTTSAATTGSWITVSVSRTINAAATAVFVVLQSQAGSAGTYYFDNAMLVIGPAPAPYRPLHPAEEWARCQRYYEVMGGVSSTLFLRGYQAASTLAGTTLFYRVSKGGTPTITKNGTWAVTNCAQPAVGAPSVDSCNITTTVTALGDFSFTPNSSDDTVTVEYNP